MIKENTLYKIVNNSYREPFYVKSITSEFDTKLLTQEHLDYPWLPKNISFPFGNAWNDKGEHMKYPELNIVEA